MGSDFSTESVVDAGMRGVRDCCQPTTNTASTTEMEFDEDSVIIYDIVSCRVHNDGRRPKSRYVFLLPGRLIHSSETKNLKVAFTTAVEDYSFKGTGLDISFRTQIEELDSKSLRLWNQTLDDDGAPMVNNAHTTPRHQPVRRAPKGAASTASAAAASAAAKRVTLDTPPDTPGGRSVATVDSFDAVESHDDFEPTAHSLYDDVLFKGIHRKDLPTCVIMRFQTEDDMAPWIHLLEVEKNKLNFPRHLFDPPADEAFVEAFEISVHEIFELNARNNPLKSFIFECRMANGPGPIFKYLYDLFFALVECTDVIDAAVSFASFLDIVVSDVATALVVVGFHFGPEIVADLATKLSQMSGRFNFTGELDDGVGLAPNSTTKLKAPVLLNLVGYISEKVRKVKWRKNGPVLCDMFGYPMGSSLHSRKAVAWFTRLQAREGRFRHPFHASWDVLRLLVEPSPFCGYYFLDFYASRGDVASAREVAALLPYKTNAVFVALKAVSVGDDGGAAGVDVDAMGSPVLLPPSSRKTDGSSSKKSDDCTDINYSVFGDGGDGDDTGDGAWDEGGVYTQRMVSFSDADADAHNPASERKSPDGADRPRLAVQEVAGAHFVAFLEWERVQRAYEEFEWANLGNVKLPALLAEARAMYRRPLVTAAHRTAAAVTAAAAAAAGKHDGADGEEAQSVCGVVDNDAALLRDCVRQLSAGESSGARGRRRGPPLLRLLEDVYLKWLLHAHAEGPHAGDDADAAAAAAAAAAGTRGLPNTLAIALLSILSWAGQTEGSDSRQSRTQPPPPPTPPPLPRGRSRSVVVEVGVGEDRCLFLAMAAALVVRRLRKNVHILYASEESMREAHRRLAPFLAATDVQASCNDFAAPGQVVYCTQGALCQHYRYRAFRGRNPLPRGAVLLVHDVDSPRVLTEPLSVFARRDDQLTRPMKVYFDLFLQIGDEAVAPNDVCGPDTKAAYDRARRAWEQFEAMDVDRPGGYAYCEATGRHEHVDADGAFALHKASLGLDMVRYQYDDREPVVQSLFFFQSAPYVLTSHDAVVGLGAASRQPADAERRQAVQALLRAWSFTVPLERPQVPPPGTVARLHALDLRPPSAAQQGSALDLKPAPPGGPAAAAAAPWLSADLTTLFDGTDGKAAPHQGGHEGLPVGAPTVPGKAASSNGAAGAAGSDAGSTAGGGGAATASELLESLAAAAYEAGLGLGLGQGAPAAPPPPPPAPPAPPAGHHETAAVPPLVEKGQLMNELCELFYHKYPYEGGKWPDKPAHRCFVDFLEDEKLHTPAGVKHFAAVMRLAPPTGPPR